MDLAALMDRKGELESSLKNIEQSFHIVTGHLSEVNYQIRELAKNDSTLVDSNDALPVE